MTPNIAFNKKWSKNETKKDQILMKHTKEDEIHIPWNHWVIGHAKIIFNLVNIRMTDPTAYHLYINIFSTCISAHASHFLPKTPTKNGQENTEVDQKTRGKWNKITKDLILKYLRV